MMMRLRMPKHYCCQNKIFSLTCDAFLSALIIACWKENIPAARFNPDLMPITKVGTLGISRWQMALAIGSGSKYPSTPVFLYAYCCGDCHCSDGWVTAFSVSGSDCAFVVISFILPFPATQFGLAGLLGRA